MKILVSLALLATAPWLGAETGLPQLRRQGTTAQLIVDGQPLVLLAGELHNSSASSLDYMAPIWDKLVALRLNTVLATVSWELTEPAEGRFDFTLVDGLVKEARRHKLRLVLLWFGSWKNGVSSYTPAWVKRDTQRFPRAIGRSNGNQKDLLSPFSDANRAADARAFVALMRHLREIDGNQHTVVMMQVENEVGIKPEPRDLSAAATAAFQAPVPAALIAYLRQHKDALLPELKAKWTGKKTGTWTEVFGEGIDTDELFMAWHYARYIGQIAQAGKEAYALPMYVNAWLDGDGAPGTYPVAGRWPKSTTSGAPPRRPWICTRPTFTCRILPASAPSSRVPATRSSFPSTCAMI
jgi:beta-galactosidase GanA